MKIGDRVSRRGGPDIVGTISAVCDGKATVYWSQHFSQQVDLAKLKRAEQDHAPQTRKEKHNDEF
jgi:hypothetical protein